MSVNNSTDTQQYPQFKLEIDLDNDAFIGALDEIDNDELAAVIRQVAERVRDHGTHTGLDYPVRDYNGNTVGRWSIGEEN